MSARRYQPAAIAATVVALVVPLAVTAFAWLPVAAIPLALLAFSSIARRKSALREEFLSEGPDQRHPKLRQLVKYGETVASSHHWKRECPVCSETGISSPLFYTPVSEETRKALEWIPWSEELTTSRSQDRPAFPSYPSREDWRTQSGGRRMYLTKGYIPFAEHIECVLLYELFDDIKRNCFGCGFVDEIPDYFWTCNHCATKKNAPEMALAGWACQCCGAKRNVNSKKNGYCNECEPRGQQGEMIISLLVCPRCNALRRLDPRS